MDFFEVNLGSISSINFIFAGIMFMIVFMIYLTGARYLNSKLHALFWFIVFLYIIGYNLTSSDIIESRFNFYEYLLFFIPIFGWFYVLTLKLKRFNPLLLFLFIIPIIAIFLKSRIVLFYFYYDIFSWLPMLVTSIVIFIKRDKADNKEKKIDYYIFVWTLSIFLVFFCYLIINAVLSLSNGYPIQLLFVLPCLFTVSSLIVFVIFYKTNLYFNNDIVEKSYVYERQTVTEKLASSLVHEIKNPIAAVKSLNQQLQSKFKEMSEESVKKYLEIMDSDLDRIKNLSDAFLKTCKRESVSNNDSSDIYIQLNASYDLIRFDLQKKEVKLTIDKGIVNHRVKLSPYHLRQIFLNLIYNSIEADAKNINITHDVKNNYLYIFVEDDGNGIALKDVKDLFIPFKSTKESGTGLGLAICRNILTQNHGDIEFVSSFNGKTIFKITLELIEIQVNK